MDNAQQDRNGWDLGPRRQSRPQQSGSMPVWLLVPLALIIFVVVPMLLTMVKIVFLYQVYH